MTTSVASTPSTAISNPATGSSTLGPTYDPTSTATALATEGQSDARAQLQTDTTNATAEASALTALQTAMTNFDSAVQTLSNMKGVVANTASFSSAVGTATATTQALPGNYSFYVQQLATAGQVSYGGLSNSTAAGSGSLNVTLANGSSFTVDLANADTNGDGQLSPQEIAAAINTAAQNNSQVTASTMTINGASTLVLTSKATGAANAASIDATNVTNAALKAELDNTANKTQLVTPQDAIIWVGAQGTGTQVQQASNTFNIVDNVAMTFTSAQAAGAAPVTLSVGTDTTTTASNVQSFVTAYNALQTLLNTQTSEGDPTNTVAAGAFAGDAGVAALQRRLNDAVRQVTNGQSLVNYGVSATLDASNNVTLSLDTTRLNTAIAANPTGLNNVFGSAQTGSPTGVLGAVDTLMNQWTSSATGQISVRQSAVTAEQKDIQSRSDELDTQYNNAYARYLAQFTALQTLQSQMTSNSNLMTALFSSSSS